MRPLESLAARVRLQMEVLERLPGLVEELRGLVAKADPEVRAAAVAELRAIAGWPPPIRIEALPRVEQAAAPVAAAPEPDPAGKAPAPPEPSPAGESLESRVLAVFRPGETSTASDIRMRMPQSGRPTFHQVLAAIANLRHAGKLRPNGQGKWRLPS